MGRTTHIKLAEKGRLTTELAQNAIEKCNLLEQFISNDEFWH